MDIPAGIGDNETLLLKQRGHISGDRWGDVKLMIQLVIPPECPFTRQGGVDLVLEKRLTLREALCGGFTIEFDFFNGKRYCLTHPRGKQIIVPGFTRTIPGMGITRRDPVTGEIKTTGNLLIHYCVEFPSFPLSEEQLEGIERVFE